MSRQHKVRADRVRPRRKPARAPAPFRQLTRAQIRTILQGTAPRRHDEGAAIFREGEPAERFTLILDQVVRVVRTSPAGEQVILRHIPSGQLIGIAMAMGGTTHPAAALAASEPLTPSWPERLWTAVVERYSGLAIETWATVGRQLEQLHDDLAAMATQAFEQRVAAAILRMVSQTGRVGEGGIGVPFPVTRADIAEMTGTTLHAVSRLLSAWERDGPVESRRRHVVVTASQRLVALSGAGG